MKPRYAHGIDDNQAVIVQALLAAGCTIVDASAVGGGFPDLIVGRQGQNYLLEVKNPDGKNRLEKLQKIFHETWQGQAIIVRGPEEALAAVGALAYVANW